MKFELQPLIIPSGFKIIKNDFTTYDPEVDFAEEQNLYYLTEDLCKLNLDIQTPQIWVSLN